MIKIIFVLFLLSSCRENIPPRLIEMRCVFNKNDSYCHILSDKKTNGVYIKENINIEFKKATIFIDGAIQKKQINFEFN